MILTYLQCSLILVKVWFKSRSFVCEHVSVFCLYVCNCLFHILLFYVCSNLTNVEKTYQNLKPQHKRWQVKQRVLAAWQQGSGRNISTKVTITCSSHDLKQQGSHEQHCWHIITSLQTALHYFVQQLFLPSYVLKNTHC